MGTIDLYYNVQQATKGMVSCCNEREHVTGIVLNIQAAELLETKAHTCTTAKQAPRYFILDIIVSFAIRAMCVGPQFRLPHGCAGARWLLALVQCPLMHATYALPACAGV